MANDDGKRAEQLVENAIFLLNEFLKGSVKPDAPRAWELVVAMQNVVDEMRQLRPPPPLRKRS